MFAFSEIVPALRMLVVLSALTGLVYPLVMTGIAQIAFPKTANGSLIVVNGKTLGSTLIGQPFDDPKYFWSRPSATSPQPYNGASSGASNQGARNPALADAVKDRIKALRDADPENRAPVPVDLVTASGSGLDPHISVAAAEYQIGRVAKARGLPEQQIRSLVGENTEGRTFGILGEPRVNVVAVNLALDRAGNRNQTGLHSGPVASWRAGRIRPRIEQFAHDGRIAGTSKPLAKCPVAEHRSGSREELQVSLVGLLGNDQSQKHGDGFPIGRVKRDAVLCSHEDAPGGTALWHARMRNRDTVPQGRRPQLFAIGQALEDLCFDEATLSSKHSGHTSQQRLLVRYVKVERDVLDRQQLTHGIHVALTGYAHASERRILRRRLVFVLFIARTRLVQVNCMGIFIEVDELGITAPGDERIEQFGRLIVRQKRTQLLQHTVDVDAALGSFLQARCKHLKQAELHDRLPEQRLARRGRSREEIPARLSHQYVVLRRVDQAKHFGRLHRSDRLAELLADASAQVEYVDGLLRIFQDLEQTHDGFDGYVGDRFDAGGRGDRRGLRGGRASDDPHTPRRSGRRDLLCGLVRQD